MPCYHPVPAYRTPDGVVFSQLGRFDILGSIEIACGQCIGCRLRRAQDWTLRIVHESKCHDYNCFVTLTYDEAHMPPHRSLLYSDFQLFMKRLRSHFARVASARGANGHCGVRFFMCGEYGPSTLRPHYHACLFGLDFRLIDGIPHGKSGSGYPLFTSPLLTRLWSNGFASVSNLDKGTAAYNARYILSKVTGDKAEEFYSSVDADGVVHKRVPEFCRCSLKPGIGANWYARYGSDVYPSDFVVKEGRKYPAPRYYDKLKRRSGDVVMDGIEFARVEKAKLRAADNVPERLAVRELVEKARVSFKKRESV